MSNNTEFKSKIADLASGKLKVSKNVQDFLAEIEKNDKKYNITLEINPNSKEIAEKLDKKREKGDKLGSLFGLCFLIKSNISKKNMNVSCSSKTLEKYRGSYDSDVVRKIEEEDGIILGVVNNDEFASGASGENSAFGPTKNPAAEKRVPGGSSSGSAAAVAAGFCDIALGSDTGGSIRNPASHCGIIGIKPSYGRVSRYGLVDLAMSFDQIGPLSKSPLASALAMEVISGHSRTDSTTVDADVPKYSEVKAKAKYKIGIVSAFDSLVKDKKIKELFDKRIEELKKEGHEIVELDIKHIELAVQAYYPIVYTEFYSGTRKFDGIKYGEQIESVGGEEILRRIFGGKEISRSEFDGAYYKKALRVKEIIAEEFTKAFGKVDFILTPVTPTLPHEIGKKITVDDMYAYDAFTTPANLAGICGGVIPNGEVDGVPVGLQILCDRFKEDILFGSMQALVK